MYIRHLNLYQCFQQHIYNIKRTYAEMKWVSGYKKIWGSLYFWKKIKAGDLDVLIRWGVANHKNLIPTLFPLDAAVDFVQGILISSAVEKTLSLWGFSYANTLGFQVLRNMHIFSLLELQEKYLINKFKFNVKLDIQCNFENNF